MTPWELSNESTLPIAHIRQDVRVPAIRLVSTAKASGDELAEIRRLLDRSFDDRLSEEDWEHALGGWHIVIVDAGAPVAHAAVVPRNLMVADRTILAGYVEAVATAPERQREGLGSLAMVEASALVRGRFEMGALSTGRHSFYERLGWQRWRGPTFVRNGSDVTRTEDDDDAVMVLRFGLSQALCLTATLSCESRPGDDW